MIGSAITPVTLGSPSASAAQSSSAGTVGSNAGSGLNFLGTSPAASTASSAAPAASGASGVSGDAGAAIGAANLGGKLTGCGTLSSAAGLAANALAIYNGVKEGGVLGYGSAAVNAVKGANTVDSLATGSGFLSAGEAAGLGAAGNVLGIASGIKQGGIAGYGSAALNAYQLYGNVSTAVNAYEGTTAAGTAATAAAGTDAAAAGAGAGLGAAASAGLVGVAIAPFLYGESKPGIQLSSTTWGNINNEISAGLNKNGTVNTNSTVQQRLTAAQQLSGLLNGITNPANPNDISGADPAAMLAGMAQYGITDVSQIQPLVNSLYNSIPTGQMPGTTAGVTAAKGGDLGVASGSGSKNTTKSY
jgi:hypothetical protein